MNLVHATMADVDTSPSVVDMATEGTEVVPWVINAAGAVADAGGTGVSSPSSQMINRTTGTTVALTDAPTAAGTSITQTVRSAELVAGDTYDVYVTYTVTGAASTTELLAHFTINAT